MDVVLSALITGVQCIMIPGLGDLLVLSCLVGNRDDAPADDVVPGALQVAGDVVLVFGGRCGSVSMCGLKPSFLGEELTGGRQVGACSAVQDVVFFLV